MEKYDLITILGPTASGKTPLAAALAYKLDTEIISGDSRQVYRRMDLGTGKDLEDRGSPPAAMTRRRMCSVTRRMLSIMAGTSGKTALFLRWRM